MWETGGHIMAHPCGFSSSPHRCSHETKKEVFSEGFVANFGMILRKRVTMENGVILVPHDPQAPGERN